jgi:GTPase SAR1 family protein
VLVGNKIDLLNERAVSTDEGRTLAKKFGVPFLEVSAKDNTRVDDIFVELIRQIKRWRKAHPELEIKKKKTPLCVMI